MGRRKEGGRETAGGGLMDEAEEQLKAEFGAALDSPSSRPRGQARRAAESRVVSGAMRREMRSGEKKNVQINFRSTESFDARLKRLAVAHKLSIAGLIELAVERLAKGGAE
jgi:hypothetical protein